MESNAPSPACDCLAHRFGIAADGPDRARCHGADLTGGVAGHPAVAAGPRVASVTFAVTEGEQAGDLGNRLRRECKWPRTFFRRVLPLLRPGCCGPRRRRTRQGRCLGAGVRRSAACTAPVAVMWVPQGFWTVRDADCPGLAPALGRTVRQRSADGAPWCGRWRSLPRWTWSLTCDWPLALTAFNAGSQCSVCGEAEGGQPRRRGVGAQAARPRRPQRPVGSAATVRTRGH